MGRFHLRGFLQLRSGGCPNRKASLLVDFGRYLIDLLVFVGITVVLMCSLHLLVLWHKKRKYAKLPRLEERSRPGRNAGAPVGHDQVRDAFAINR